MAQGRGSAGCSRIGSSSPLVRSPSLRFCLLVVGIAAATGCQKPDAPIVAELKDDFERSSLGPSYRATGGDYRLVRGEIAARRLDHHPIWLRRRLPRDVAIEFDARPTSPGWGYPRGAVWRRSFREPAWGRLRLERVLVGVRRLEESPVRPVQG